MVRTAARDDDRVRDQVAVPLNEIAPYRRQPFQRPHRRLVAALRRSRREVLQELREGVLARPEEDRVRVRRRLVRQRRDVQAAERDVGAARAIVIGDLVGAIRVGDVDLNDHQVGFVVEIELLDVLVLQRDLEVGSRYAARVARPRGGKSEYLIGRQ